MSNDTPPAGSPAPYEPPSSGSAPPYGSPQPGAAVERPKTVDVAFWLVIAAAVLSLVGLLLSLGTIDAAREEALRQLDEQGQGDVVPAEAVESAIWIAFVVGSIVSVVVAGLYVLFGVLMRKGAGWARFVLAAFAALAIFGILGGFGIGALQFACIAAAVVLSFLPASNAYFQAAAQRRARGPA